MSKAGQTSGENGALPEQENGSDLPLVVRFVSAPRPGDAAATRAGKASIAELVQESERRGGALAALLDQSPLAQDVLFGVFAHSPFLSRLLRGRAGRLEHILASAPETAHAAIVDEAAAAWRQAADQAALMKTLRRLRAENALMVALADLGGVWGVERVTQALTAFADACVGAAARFLLSELARQGRLQLANPDEPEKGCGLTILALGKHGAGELNYSSDIDIVIFYDPEAPLKEGLAPSQVFVRFTQSLAKILQERTGDGYVFRVDLRLRPDPGSTAPAISLPAAFAYYESVGQNWERAAYIKARPIAGDLALGAAFLQDLRPFIWRKYFDFATIADIHAMKRQIHVVKGHDQIALAGHDIKLGRGGIREIEFFVQTQQLVFGGRRENLRGSRTLDMLAALAADGWISTEARDELGDCYRFLRTLEHRLQMVGDEQTQRLPDDAGQLRDFARFAGFASSKALGAALEKVARTVQHHYGLLFEEGPALATETGSLVFTGSSDDPDTLETLRRIGFRDPAAVTETIRGWHFGRRSAITSARAREVVTELTPALLGALGRTADPDGALLALDRAFGRMPASVELLSMLRSNERLLNLFADLLGTAPRLADIVSERPHVLDAIIDPAFAEDAQNLDSLAERIRSHIGKPPSFEDFLDRVRDAARLSQFVVGARMLTGIYAPERAGMGFAVIADTVIAGSLEAVREAFSADHGVVPRGEMVVMAYGRLGSRQLTASSDLDLVVIYDFDPDQPESDGARPLHASVYFNRLTQRLVSALTVPTRRGRLYDVDMRLRPDGRKGAVATQFSGFTRYQSADAETWEHMALTRARVVAGDPELAQRVADVVHGLIDQPRDRGKLAKSVRDMRALVAREKGDRNAWDLKLASGGLMDIEFVAQYLALAWPGLARGIAEGTIAGGEQPDQAARQLMAAGAGQIIRLAMEQGVLAADDGEQLCAAFTIMEDVLQWERLTVDGAFEPKNVAPAVLKRIANAVGLPDVKMLEAHLATLRGEVRAIFRRVLGG